MSFKKQVSRKLRSVQSFLKGFWRKSSVNEDDVSSEEDESNKDKDSDEEEEEDEEEEGEDADLDGKGEDAVSLLRESTRNPF
eukprot:gene4047-14128_t